MDKIQVIILMAVMKNLKNQENGKKSKELKYYKTYIKNYFSFPTQLLELSTNFKYCNSISTQKKLKFTANQKIS